MHFREKGDRPLHEAASNLSTVVQGFLTFFTLG
jgi:hypothetical protein